MFLFFCQACISVVEDTKTMSHNSGCVVRTKIAPMDITLL